MFIGAKFGNLPLPLVMQALQFGQRFRREDVHLDEIGIATLTSCFVNANTKPNAKKSSPKDFFVFNAAQTFSSNIADAYFSLIKDKKLPRWVVGLSPIDELQQAKTNNHPVNNRLLVGKGIAIFSPTITDRQVESDFVVYSECKWGYQLVTDVDTGGIYDLFIPPSEYDQQYCREWVAARR